MRRFRAFFAGWCSAKESATRYRANLLTVSVTVSRVVTRTVGAFKLDVSGVKIEGSARADKEDKDSEWVVSVECDIQLEVVGQGSVWNTRQWGLAPVQHSS